MTIRIRVWDGERMHYPQDFVDYTSLFLSLDGRVFEVDCHDEHGAHAYESEGSIPMLSPGLTDKDGREIFAGDIVSFDFPMGTEAHAMEFKNGLFQVALSNGAYFPVHYFLQVKHKVIGNIYENPELIENHKETPCH